MKILKNIEENPYKNYIIAAILNTVMFYIFIAAAGTVSKQYSKPQVIDVYRDKTELIITSINNSPIDSTVVFKNK